MGNENILMTGQNTCFPESGPRNVTPTEFLRQSPSPSAPSPAGLSQAPNSNQMSASSPAFVPSLGGQMTPMSVPQQRSVGMAPSPSSSLNTPGPTVPTPSPCNLQEDQAFREKVRQLSKYIEPLRRMIARMGNDDVEKLRKMKKLLEIVSNPSKRMPLEILLKCEVVLEKLGLKPEDYHLRKAIAIRRIINECHERMLKLLTSPEQGPCDFTEEQACREKLRQLCQYTEPLRELIDRTSTDDVEMLIYLKKLLAFLTNPARTSLETLLECEVVLVRLGLKRMAGTQRRR